MLQGFLQQALLFLSEQPGQRRFTLLMGRGSLLSVPFREASSATATTAMLQREAHGDAIQPRRTLGFRNFHPRLLHDRQRQLLKEFVDRSGFTRANQQHCSQPALMGDQCLPRRQGSTSSSH